MRLASLPPLLLAAGLAGGGGAARAEDAPPVPPASPRPAPPAPASSDSPASGPPSSSSSSSPSLGTPAPASPLPAAASPSSPGPGGAPPPAGLTDEELLAASAAEGEVVQIWDERPTKPFDRDTAVRLSGEELAARGATDLASALALLPDVTVRDVGRGGFNLDIRGARKGAVRVLVDGVSVSDPYYGTFDVSTIPITDIEQIRVSTAASSPIDGPGGPGGVVEVHTRDAIGPQLVIARLTSDTLPTFGASGTARVALGPHLGLRLSSAQALGARELALPMDAAVGEARRTADGAARLEYRRGDRRIVADAAVDQRHYVAPPSDVAPGAILMIDRETSARAQLAADDRAGRLQLQGRAWADYLARRSRTFRDPALLDQTQVEDLAALRLGAQAMATHPLGVDARWAASLTVDHERARVATADEPVARGATTLVELAGDAQYARGPVVLDGAVGVAAPFGVAAAPWLEAKLVGKWRPRRALDVAVTLARKGRTPSLRERFDAVLGNPDLAPELASLAEVRAVARPAWGQLEVAPFVRRSTGTVRVGPPGSPQAGAFANLGALVVHGVDVLATLHAGPVDVGGGYAYVRASSDALGADPLDRLPAHRADGWVRATRGRLSGLARVRRLGETLDQTVVVPGSTTVELAATARLGGYLAVLRVEDLLDARPETRAGYHAAGRTASLVLQATWR